MRLFCLIIFTFFLSLNSLFAQQPITIDKNDIPSAGDTIRYSIAANPPVIDIAKDGADQTWDFQNLTFASQYVDTFTKFSEFPGVYRFFLNLQGKTVKFGKKEGKFLSNLPIGNQLAIENIFSFFNKDNGKYEKVAYGVTFGGQDVPIPFDNHDVIYKFPLKYGNKDSSKSHFTFPPAGFSQLDTNIYFEENHKRVNEVDAWGTLKTPYGTFETIRVKTTHYYEDSFYFQGTGQTIEPPKQVIYKWLTKNGGAPVLTAVTQSVAGNRVVSSATYQDSFRTRNFPTGNDETYVSEMEADVSVYPNPNDGQFLLKFGALKSGTFSLIIINSSGKQVASENVTIPKDGVSSYELEMDLSYLKKGSYTILMNKPGHNIDYEHLVIQ